MYEEHSIIMNAIELAKQTRQLIGKDDSAYEKTIRQLISFFRNYADKFHHYKEEEILFPAMSKQNELLGEGVLKEMLENHDDFREMIRRIETNLDAQNFYLAQNEVEKYGEALLDHIAVENDEVFIMAETIFNEDELEKIGHRFQDCDQKLGEEIKQELSSLLDDLRSQLFLTLSGDVVL